MELIENSLYQSKDEYDALLKDKEKIADALLFNFFGFISLFAASPKREVKEWKNNEGRVRVDKITDENTDVSISVKLAYESGMIPRSTADKMTRLLSLFKQGIIAKPSDVNDDLTYDLFKLCKFDTMNKPSVKLRPIVDEYIDRELNIAFLGRDLYRFSKLPQFKVISSEFFSMYKTGQYNQIYTNLENGLTGIDVGVPENRIKKLTVKTIIHRKKPTGDQTGLTQVVDAVKKSVENTATEISHIESDIEKAITDPINNPTNIVEPIEPSKSEPKKFDPYSDKSNGELHNKYNLDQATKSALDNSNFKYADALSSPEAFIEEYKNTFMAVNIVNPFAALESFYSAIHRTLKEQDIARPEWILQPGEWRRGTYYKSAKDQGVFQTLFMIHMSYYFANSGSLVENSFMLDDMSTIFKKMTGTKNIVGGTKKVKEQSMKWIMQYKADVNFNDTMTWLLKDKAISYESTIFKYMFAKYVFDLLLNDGDYKLDERFWFIKELNAVTKEKVADNIREFYDQFNSNLVVENKVLLDSGTYTYTMVLILDDSIENKVVPLLEGMIYAQLDTIRKRLQRVSSAAGFIFIFAYSQYITRYSLDQLIGMVFDSDGDALNALAADYVFVSTMKRNKVADYERKISEVVAIVFHDIAAKGNQSKYLSQSKKTEISLLNMINFNDIDYSIIDKLDVEKIRNNLVDFLELYDINRLDQVDIAQNIDIFEANKAKFELNFRTNAETLINKIKNDSVAISDNIADLDNYFKIYKELNKYGSGYDYSYFEKEVRELIRYAVNENKASSMALNSSMTRSKQTGTMLRIILDECDEDQRKSVYYNTRTEMKTFIGQDEFVNTCIAHPDILDDFSITYSSDKMIKVNGYGQASRINPNYMKFINFYNEKIFTEELNGVRISANKLLDTNTIPLDIFERYIHDSILYGYTNPGNYVDLSGFDMNKKHSKIDTKYELTLALEDSQLNEIMLQSCYARYNPTAVDPEILEQLSIIAEMGDDDQNPFTLYMKDLNEAIYDTMFKISSLQAINKLPNRLKKDIINYAVRDQYSEVLLKNINQVRAVLDLSQFDILVEELDEDSLVKVAMLNGIGLETLSNVDYDKYENKEQFFNDLTNIFNISIKDDINESNVMPINNTITDFEQIKPINQELYKTANGLHGNVAPIIEKVYIINMDRTRFEDFVERDKENPRSDSKGQIRTMMFHGTGSVAMSFISKFGFREIPDGLGLATSGKMLGAGIYLAENIDKSLSYIGDGGFKKSYKEGYILVCDVCLGEYEVDYLDARDRTYLISPEWCIKNYKDQLVVKEIYKLRSTSLTEYNSIVGQ